MSMDQSAGNTAPNTPTSNPPVSNTPASFQEASGKIRYTLRNDIMFHYVLQKSKKALKGLMCSLKNIPPEQVQDVFLTNPIDYSSYNGKEVILDVRILLNNKEILDIELQMYHDTWWKNRSILYLCRSFDSIGSGENYSELKPTTFVAIMTEDLFPEQPEFYSHFLLENTRYHYPYTTNFCLNVLNLRHIDLATQEDQDNELVYWAQMFMAETWEDLKRLSEHSATFKEVAEQMYAGNIQPEEVTLMEGHQRFLDYQRAMYENGVLDTKAELEPVIEEQRKTLQEQQATLQEQLESLREKDEVIEILKERIKALESSSKIDN